MFFIKLATSAVSFLSYLFLVFALHVTYMKFCGTVFAGMNFPTFTFGQFYVLCWAMSFFTGAAPSCYMILTHSPDFLENQGDDYSPLPTLTYSLMNIIGAVFMLFLGFLLL